jgi:hypothetical protein
MSLVTTGSSAATRRNAVGEQTAISWPKVMKESANRAIHLEVRAGIRPHANTLPCSACGHIYAPGERRHEWDHHLGYDREYWFSAVVLCTKCHHAKSAKAQQTHCVHGHPFDDKNTVRRRNGTRGCRACQHLRGKAQAAKKKTARHARGLRNRWSSRKEMLNG